MPSVLKWNKDYDILNISLKSANIIAEDIPSEIIHMSKNYLSSVHCLTKMVWSRTSRVCWTLSILIFEISSREGAFGSFARVNIGLSGLTLIARKGTNVILIAILEQRITVCRSEKCFPRLSHGRSWYSIASINICWIRWDTRYGWLRIATNKPARFTYWGQ